MAIKDMSVTLHVERPDLDKTMSYVARMRIIRIAEHIRIGWANYSYVFYIGGVSVLLAEVLGAWAVAAPVVTLGFFYYAGKFHEHVQDAKSDKDS